MCVWGGGGISGRHAWLAVAPVMSLTPRPSRHPCQHWWLQRVPLRAHLARRDTGRGMRAVTVSGGITVSYLHLRGQNWWGGGLLSINVFGHTHAAAITSRSSLTWTKWILTAKQERAAVKQNTFCFAQTDDSACLTTISIMLVFLPQVFKLMNLVSVWDDTLKYGNILGLHQAQMCLDFLFHPVSCSSSQLKCSELSFSLYYCCCLEMKMSSWTSHLAQKHKGCMMYFMCNTGYIFWQKYDMLMTIITFILKKKHDVTYI